MNTIQRARCDRGHYLPTGEIPYSLDPEAWDDTCRHQTKPAERKPSAETFGHEPVTDDGIFFDETSDDPPVCARCTRTIRAWLPIVVGQHPDGRVITSDPEKRVAFEVAVLWPCTSAIVLGLVDHTAP